MTRLARVVLPGVVHHITQRGVRSMDIFYRDKDRKEYLFLMNRQAERYGLEFVCYCLMTNHVHLLVIPEREDSLRLGIGEAHRLYTRYINFREKTRGYLFQGRFFSCPMDDPYFITAARYVERNPVRAKICESAEDHQWSSARFHLGKINKDPLIKYRYEGIGTISEWTKFLKSEPRLIKMMKVNFRTGRPLGSNEFLQEAEATTGRNLIPKKGGRPRK
jgi:putative transposase